MIHFTYTYSIGLFTATLLVGCGGGDTSTTQVGTTTTQVGTTTTQCQNIQPLLTTLNSKYTNDYKSNNTTRTTYEDFEDSEDSEGSEGSEGSEDSEDSEGSEGSEGSKTSHNEGRDCLECHSFASAGTVFNTLNAGNNTPGAAGYKIKLSTGIVYSSARGTGNSLSSSFPNGNFTAQVMDPNGNIVNSSANMSHNGARRACNSCHTASGNSGAPGRITSKHLSSTTSTIPVTTNTTSCVSFNSNILPILTAKCKSCHGSNGRFTVTTANATYANISTLKGSATAGGQYLLDKSNNTIGHGGGQIISTSSGEYTTIKAWINNSAPNN